MGEARAAVFSNCSENALRKCPAKMPLGTPSLSLHPALVDTSVSIACTKVSCMQANIPQGEAVEDWMLDALATKVRQSQRQFCTVCYLPDTCMCMHGV